MCNIPVNLLLLRLLLWSSARTLEVSALVGFLRTWLVSHYASHHMLTWGDGAGWRGFGENGVEWAGKLERKWNRNNGKTDKRGRKSVWKRNLKSSSWESKAWVVPVGMVPPQAPWSQMHSHALGGQPSDVVGDWWMLLGDVSVLRWLSFVSNICCFTSM